MACFIGVQDLLERGATLAEILRAGQWKSAAFMRYLNLADIEKVHEHATLFGECFVMCSLHLLRAPCWKLLVTQMMSSGSIDRSECPSARDCERFSHHIA